MSVCHYLYKKAQLTPGKRTTGYSRVCMKTCFCHLTIV